RRAGQRARALEHPRREVGTAHEAPMAAPAQRAEVESVAAADVDDRLVTGHAGQIERAVPEINDGLLVRVDRLAGDEIPVVAVLGGDVVDAQASCSSSFLSASSSERLSAKLSSETRTPRAFTSIAFSPAERPLLASRSARFRTTSATW